MGRPTILLVNPNRMRPPIGPLGLEYLVASLQSHGYEPCLCDLAFASEWESALTDAMCDVKPFAVGVTIRNIDDAYFASRDFVLERTANMVRHIMQCTDAPVILGGIGFSMAPREVLQFTGAPYGVAGEGEEAFPSLLACLSAGQEPSNIAGAVFRRSDNDIVLVPPVPYDPTRLPPPCRTFADNARYFTEGGQAGIETKRGCAQSCIYCVEPMAKGKIVRVRPPEAVAAEFAALLEQGVNVVHLCDSEFNLPPSHAHGVCDALCRAGLAPRIRWYTYAAPVPFDRELAQVMARAGCVGINFGADHADEDMLRRLGRNYRVEDLCRTAMACRDAGIAVMFDLLLGGPGETRESVACAIGRMREIAPDRVGLSCGIRIYPNTPLAQMVRHQGPFTANPHLHGAVEDNEALLRPIFYVQAGLGKDIHRIVTELVGDDKRFLHADPSQIDGNYNYNNNSLLANAIRDGERGAYWDILRRMEEATS